MLTGAAQVEEVEHIFRALSDRTRVRILHLLRAGPLCVGDLAAVLGVAQPFVSRHLASLRNAGLAVDERRGQWMFYALAPARSAFRKKLFACLDAALTGHDRKDEAALAALQRKGGCCPQHTKRSPGRDRD